MKKKNEKVKSIFVEFLLSVVTSGAILQFVVPFIYKNYFETPVIQSRVEENKIIFTVDSEFRSLTMRLYPQFLIVHKGIIVKAINISKYYEKNFLEFNNDGVCSVEIKHQSYAEKVRDYLDLQIERELSSRHLEEETTIVKISTLGIVEYQNLRGEMKKSYYVILEKGMVYDEELSSPEVSSRLSKMKLIMRENLQGVEYNQRIQEIVNDVLNEIEKKSIKNGE